ncbi:MAG: hypothetical protein AB7Q01_17515 [Gammaproteobacteria bacterium]
MIGVFVTFRLDGALDVSKVRGIAENARPMFERMPHLRSKTFTYDSGRGEVTNFYVWDSKEAAEAFFSGQMLELVTSLYGVRPSVNFAEIAMLVDNTHA